MFVKSQTVRKPNGKSYTYYRLVRAYREGGKPNFEVVANLGALTTEEAGKLARRFAGIAGEALPTDDTVEVGGHRYFGAPLLVERLVSLLALDRFVLQAVEGRGITYDIVAVLKVMLCAHLFKGGSRAELAVWEWQQKLFWHGHRVPDLAYHHMLRSLKVFSDVKESVEAQLFLRLVDLFSLEVDLVFYDLTSSFVEGLAAGSTLRKRGYSRDGRPDCKQLVIGLVVTREGFPISCRVFDGNTVDKSTLKTMVDDLKERFKVKRCIWVSDTGLLSEANRKLWEKSGYEYILGAGNGSRKEVQQAITQTRREADAAVKDVRLWNVPMADAGRRIVVVESEGRREKTAAILERRLQKVRGAFASLSKQVEAGKLKEELEIRVAAEKALKGSGVCCYFSYQAAAGKLWWQEDETAVAARKADAGKYGLVSDTELPVAEVLAAYRTLLAAEEAFRVLKDELDLRPLWHQSDAHLEGHVVVAMWSSLLHKTLEVRMAAAGAEFSVARALGAAKEVQAVEVIVNGKSVWKMSQVPPTAEAACRAMGVGALKQEFSRWAAGAPAYHYEARTRPWPESENATGDPAA